MKVPGQLEQELVDCAKNAPVSSWSKRDRIHLRLLGIDERRRNAQSD